MQSYASIIDIHHDRASAAIARVLESYVAGELATEADLLARITEEYANLYATLQDPLITPEPMRIGDILRVSAIRTPMLQLDHDLDTAYGQLERLRSAVVAITNLCAVERSGLEQLLAVARDRVVEVKAWASDSDPTFLWASDTFKTTSRVNTDATTARIDTKLGLVTLAVEGEESLVPHVSGVSLSHVGIEATYTEGLPGNTLEIKSAGGGGTVTQAIEPTAPAFAAPASNPSANPAAMFDGDPSTWFEWEKYLVPSVQRLSPVGHAYVHRKGTSGEMLQVFGADGITRDLGWDFVIRWPGEDAREEGKHRIVKPTDWDGQGDPPRSEALTLKFLVTFDSPQPLSWIEMLPYFAGARTAGAAGVTTVGFRMTSLQVSPDGTGGWVELVTEPLSLVPTLQQPIDAVCAGIPVKDYRGVAVVPCPLARVKAFQVELSQDLPYETYIGHAFILKTVQVRDTDAKWYGGSSTKTYNEYHRSDSPDINVWGHENNGFFGLYKSGLTKTTTDAETFYDILLAHRYAIGIRDLGLLRRTYAPTSQLVTRALIFEKPVSAAALIASERIPSDWPSDRRWVGYEVSGDGVMWTPILPQNTDGSVGAVVHFAPTRRLYARITMSRPDDRPTETPVVEYYAIKAIPEDAV